MYHEIIIQLFKTIIPVVAGVYGLYYVQKHIKKQNRISDHGVKAEGVVFDLEGDSDVRYSNSDLSTDRPLFYPVIRFVTSSGEWITEKYSISSNFYKKGQKVEVTYDPENPKEFILKDFGLAYFFFYLAFFISLCAIGYGLYQTYLYVFADNSD
jgi:hypothetical protein